MTTDRPGEYGRNRVLGVLRRGPATVGDIARALDISGSAVRGHIASLESQGLVRRSGVRASGGKPAAVYELGPQADTILAKSHRQVLAALVDALEGRLGRRDAERVLRDAGRRLAPERPPAGRTEERVRRAAEILEELGGLIEVERAGGRYVIRGFDCPLGASASEHPDLCKVLEALVARTTGLVARARCDTTRRPSCLIEVGPGR